MLFELDKDKQLIHPQLGDFIEEYLTDFVLYVPYLLLFYSITLIAGFFNLFLLFTAVTLLFAYLFVVESINNKYDRPKAGAIELAEAELIRAKQNKEVPKDIYYIANYGTIIKDFVGKNEDESRKLSLNPKNTLYDFLVTKDKYMEHTLIGGSTGSGKTVAITSAYIEPLIRSGGGFIYLECKGDMPITHGVLSLAAEYGCEDDVYVLDFSGGASKYTHSLAPLKNGNAVVLNEALTNMIKIMDGDNSWVTDKALEFMQGLLFPLVIMRDLGIFVDADDLLKIKAQSWEEDLKNVNKIDFNFEALRSYATFQGAINLFYLFRELLSEKTFFNKLSNHYNYRKASDLYKTYLFPLELFLTNHGIDLSDTINIPDYFKITTPEQRKENNYAINPWTMAFSIFGNEAIFGSLVNKRYPDIDFLDVIRNNKKVVVSLPSLQNSRDKNEKIGKFITSLIKAAIGEMLNKIAAEGTTADQEIGRRFRPYKLPFMILCDEISNIGNEMMGAMASMVRSIGSGGGGIGMLFAGQSEGDLKRIGTGEYDGEQIKANIAIKYFLNLSDKYYKDTASELCGEKWYGDFDEGLAVKVGKESDINQNIRKEKKIRYEKDFFSEKLRKKTGEGIIYQDGFGSEKIICRYVEPKPATEFKLMRNISKDELISSFLDDIEKEEERLDVA